MITKEIKLKKLNKNAKVPSYGTEYAAGCDLYACIDEKEVLNPGETKLIKTGISIETPVGYAAFIFARSGLASKKGLAPANKVGVVDSDYRGEIMVALHNHSNEVRQIEPQERINRQKGKDKTISNHSPAGGTTTCRPPLALQPILLHPLTSSPVLSHPLPSSRPSAHKKNLPYCYGRHDNISFREYYFVIQIVTRLASFSAKG